MGNGRFNTIIIILDTLRLDHSKVFTSILKEYNFRFYANTISPSPWTLPAHASLFTGLYPIQHGAHETKKRKLGDLKSNVKWLTSIKLHKDEFLISKDLDELGYNTYIYTANPFITPQFGFKFSNIYQINLHSPFISVKEKIYIESLLKNRYSKKEVFKKIIKSKKYRFLIRIILNSLYWRSQKFKTRYLKYLPPRIILDKGSSALIDSIKNHYPKTPFFIFINFMEMHEPYLSDNNRDLKGITINFNDKLRKEINISLIKKAYNKDAIYLSKKLNSLLDFLSNKNILDNSLIIIGSDHGQLLGEHNKYGHGTFLYDELIRVPLWIKYPNNFKINVYEKNDNWISLVNIKKFILSALKFGFFDERYLYSSTVFSESYGTQDYIPKYAITEPKKFKRYNKYRIAIYHKDLKGIFNVHDWKLDKVISYSNSKITKKEKSFLKKKILNFLKLSIVSKKDDI